MFKRKEKEIFPLFIAITFVSFGLLTFLHDPILHAIPACIFGWNVTEWNAGILTGQTSVTSINAKMWEVWLFYMTPPLILCSLALGSAIYKPSRLIAIPALVLFMLNLASLDPEITNSDSYNGLKTLLEGGFSITNAYLIHYGIFILSIIAFAIFLYINLENRPSDSIKRRDNVF